MESWGWWNRSTSWVCYYTCASFKVHSARADPLPSRTVTVHEFQQPNFHCPNPPSFPLHRRRGEKEQMLLTFTPCWGKPPVPRRLPWHEPQLHWTRATCRVIWPSQYRLYHLTRKRGRLGTYQLTANTFISTFFFFCLSFHRRSSYSLLKKTILFIFSK